MPPEKSPLVDVLKGNPINVHRGEEGCELGRPLVRSGETVSMRRKRLFGVELLVLLRIENDTPNDTN
jgi:hypothetical protein